MDYELCQYMYNERLCRKIMKMSRMFALNQKVTSDGQKGELSRSRHLSSVMAEVKDKSDPPRSPILKAQLLKQKAENWVQIIAERQT